MLRYLKRNIIAQIVLLLTVVLLIFAGLKIENLLMTKKITYLRQLVSNEDAKVELSHDVQKKLLAIHNELNELAKSNTTAEIEHTLATLASLRNQTNGALEIIEQGGTWIYSFPVNFGGEETINRPLEYVNHHKGQVNLQVIELKAKLVELDDLVSDLTTLVKEKVAGFSNRESVAIDASIKKIHNYSKGIQPFFVRILENSNRIYYESWQEMERLKRIYTQTSHNYSIRKNLLRTVAVTFILLLGGVIIRSSRQLLAERDRYQSQLLESKETLELTVQQRTAELEKEVVERKQVQVQLAQQADFLFNSIEALSHPFYVIDAESYQVVLANSAAGNSSEGGFGPGCDAPSCYLLSHGQDTPCSGQDHPCPLQIVKETGQPVIVEHVHKNHQGEPSIVEVHGYPVFDSEGKLVQMIEYCLDVTDKKNAELALQEANNELEDKVKERTCELEEQIKWRKRTQKLLADSEKHYRRLIDNISDIITIIDAEGVVSYVSPSGERISGISSHVLTGQNIRQLVHPDDLPLFDVDSLHKHHVEHRTFEYRMRGKGGHYCYLESIIQTFQDDGHSQTYMLCSRDVTERKKAEEETRNLRMIVDQLPSSVVMTDTDGAIEYVNAAFEQLTGYSFAEVVGDNPRILKSDQTPPHVFKLMWETITAGEVWRGEVINRKKNGEFYNENILVIPIKNAIGENRHYVAVKENITELKRAQQAAEKANRAKSHFLSRMSHELRTPLNAINGFSRLMLKSKKNPLNEKQEEMTSQIHAAGNHLLSLINEILDLARIESGELSLSIEAIDPGQMIKECLALVQPLMKEKQISISNESLERLPMLSADLTRAKQVLLNLLSNAAKYNRDHGTIILRTHHDRPGFLRFEVEDSGIGIASGKQKDIFTPFTRVVDNPDAIEGTGIGMTISKQLVETMGGEIGFTSELGVGSTFWFTLPIIGTETLAQTGTPSDVNQDMTRVNSADSGHMFRVLYIEDNPANVRFMESCFDEWPEFSLDVAYSGNDGVNAAVNGQPDVILLDLNLPDIDGFHVYRKLKAQPETEFIPVVAVSADAMENTINKVYKLGFSGYISKPVDLDELQQTVNKLLKGEHGEHD
nr:PAS domain S-box protein [uncultured Desulfuromonas sp.]